MMTGSRFHGTQRLLYAREKAERINVLRSPLANGNRPCGQLETGDVVRCLEAVCSRSRGQCAGLGACSRAAATTVPVRSPVC